MLKLTRNTALLLGGAILVVALALALGLLTYAPQLSVAQQPTPLPPSSSNPPVYPNLDSQSVAQLTKEWLVFEKPEWGFRIKYPPTFFTTEWPVEKDRLYSVGFTDQKWKGMGGEIPDIDLTIYRNPQGMALQEWFTTHSGSFTPQGLPDQAIFVDPTQIQPVSVHGQNALKFVDGGLGPAPTVLIPRGQQMFSMVYAPAPNNLEPTYELMFSTLEFTK